MDARLAAKQRIGRTMGRNKDLSILRTLQFDAIRVGILAVLSSLLLCLPIVGRAHEVTPTIADFDSSDGQVNLVLRLNVEAFVAGIDLDGRSDTDESDRSDDYDLLRNMSQQELDTH